MWNFLPQKPRSRTDASQGRIIITGTGRAGTTLLVQLFTALGFDTGFSLEQALIGVDSISHAGLERELLDEANPYVIKSPWFADKLMAALEGERIRVSAAIVPMRDLFAAAESRRRATEEAARRGLDASVQPGGLWLTQDPAKQEGILLEQFHKALFPLVKFEVPLYLLEFPRLARDAAYLHRSLAPLMKEHGVREAEFMRAFERVVQPDKINTFRKTPADVPTT